MWPEAFLLLIYVLLIKNQIRKPELARLVFTGKSTLVFFFRDISRASVNSYADCAQLKFYLASHELLEPYLSRQSIEAN